MIASQTELVPYSKATEIAEKYAALTADIKRLALEMGEKITALKEVFQFQNSSSYDFDVDLEMSRTSYKLDEQGVKRLLTEFKRSAWKILIEKLQIRKLMSQSESDKLDSMLYNRQTRSFNSEPIPELPEISADTIISVMSGMIQSAPEFLTGKIQEVYKWLVPRNFDGGHKTNKRDRVGKKVIRGYCVERYSYGAYHVSYSKQASLSALDFVFHALDGAGIPEGHNGPLVDAINACKDGTGETKYFSFRFFQNGNIHLTFKNQDLLDRFNAVAVDGKNLGAEMARR